MIPRMGPKNEPLSPEIIGLIDKFMATADYAYRTQRIIPTPTMIAEAGMKMYVNLIARMATNDRKDPTDG